MASTMLTAMPTPAAIKPFWTERIKGSPPCRIVERDGGRVVLLQEELGFALGLFEQASAFRTVQVFLVGSVYRQDSGAQHAALAARLAGWKRWVAGRRQWRSCTDAR
jgi:hypothetical protein